MALDTTKLALVESSQETPTEAAKIQRRAVYEAIEAAYNDEAKCYQKKLTGAITDASLAAELKCPAALVAKVRDEFFGPAEQAEPTAEITAMQRELAFLSAEAQKMEVTIKGLGIQAKEHRQKIGVLADDIKALCLRFGWAH